MWVVLTFDNSYMVLIGRRRYVGIQGPCGEVGRLKATFELNTGEETEIGKRNAYLLRYLYLPHIYLHVAERATTLNMELTY